MADLKITNDFLDVAVEAAKVGGKICVDYFQQELQLEKKATSNLVTQADIESEQAIVEVIRKSFPDHAILAEEDHQGSIEAEHLWVVDPLDGTNNFAHQVPHFAVSIGYWHRGVPQAGVILNPIREELYYAVRGEGAYGTGGYLDHRRLAVNDGADLNECLIGCGFYYDRGAMMRATLRAVEQSFEANIHGIRRFGTASLDLIHVASGKYGGFFEYRLAPWDFAAGLLFVEEAGGKITTCSGGKLDLSESTILATNGHIHQQLLQIVKQHLPS